MRYGKTIVAVTLLLVLAVGLFMSILPLAMAEPLETYHSSWHLVRETANEDGDTFSLVYDLTGVGTTDGDFASKDSSSVLSGGAFRIRSNGIDYEGYSAGGAWMFTICGSNYADVDDTFSFNILGWSKTNGMLQTIAVGDGVIGEQAVGLYPDDGGDAYGALISLTGVTYTTSDETFTASGEFVNATVGMMARVTGTGFTNEIVDITTAGNDSVICDITTTSADCTDATIQINPAFWADTINLDETTKWPSVGVYNSGSNEVAFILIDTTGLEWIQFVISKAAAASGEAGNITIFGRRY